MTTREAFEAYIKAHQSGDCWNLWQAATNAALERAIQACKNVAAKQQTLGRQFAAIECGEVVRSLKDIKE